MHRRLETHTGIDVTGRQLLQRTVGLAVELHEDEVPNFDDLRMPRIDHFAARLGSDFGLIAQVEVNLRTRTARSRFTHLPEIIVLVAMDDVILGQEAPPIIERLLVERHAIFGASLEHRSIHPLGRQPIDVVQQLPSPLDGLFLEIIAIRPVPQHLEHRMVIGIVTYLLQVVMLARYAQTFLRIGRTRILARRITQKDVLELVHARIGEHQRGVALDDHRRRRNDVMALALEKSRKTRRISFDSMICLFIRLFRFTVVTIRNGHCAEPPEPKNIHFSSGCKITQNTLNLHESKQFFRP